jgi:hypothetical protein
MVIASWRVEDKLREKDKFFPANGLIERFLEELREFWVEKIAQRLVKGKSKPSIV